MGSIITFLKSAFRFIPQIHKIILVNGKMALPVITAGRIQLNGDYDYGFLKMLLMLLLLSQVPVFSQNRSQIDSVNTIARVWIFSNVEASIPLFRKNAQNAHDIGYRLGEAKANMNLGLALYLKGKYAASVDSYLNAIRIFEATNSVEDLVITYGDLGYQMKRRDLEGGKEYMLKAIRMAEKHNLTSSLTALYDNYGVLQEMSNQLDSASYYYEKALNLKKEIGDTVGIPYTLNHLAGLSALKKEFSKARRYLTESDRYRARESGVSGKLTNLILWGDLFHQMGNLDSAVVMYRRVIETPAAFEQNYQVTYCFDQLADIYRKEGDYKKAFESLKSYQEYKDSLVNVRTNAKIAKLQIEYETEKKDRELVEKQLKIKTRDTLLIISGLVFLLLVVISFGSYKFQRQEIKRINRQMELEAQIKRSQYRQKISEEKERISRELHDNIGSNLTFLISSIDNLTYQVKEQAVLEKLKRLSSFGRETINELRNTVWALHTRVASLEALVNKLNDIKLRFEESFESVELTVENKVAESVRLSSLQMVNLFRIIQEAIQNSLKYSGCSRIEIQFDKREQGLQVKIIDDGHGFDCSQVKNGNGLGNMKHRCERADGEFFIESGPGGTVITCLIRLNSDLAGTTA